MVGLGSVARQEALQGGGAVQGSTAGRGSTWGGGAMRWGREAVRAGGAEP